MYLLQDMNVTHDGYTFMKIRNIVNCTSEDFQEIIIYY